MKKQFLALATLSVFLLCNAQPAAAQIEHVVVIGVDGLSSSGLRNAETPVLDKLIQDGAIAWQARTVLPTVSSPNWATIITGAGPEQHGVLSNDWEVDKQVLTPITQDATKRFPSLFRVIKQQRPGAKLASVYHWDAFGRLYDRAAVDFDRHFSTPDSCVTAFNSYLAQERPTFAFLHLDHVDGAGHQHGHGSAGYLAAIAHADSLIGRVMATINKAGIREKTLLLLVSDHGGINKGHGGTSDEEITVPVLLYGAGVKRGTVITHPTYLYDVAATVAQALKLTLPEACIGRPITQAFGK